MKLEKKQLSSKLLLLFIVAFIMSITINTAIAQSDSSKVTAYFFWGDGCPHCAAEKPFLEDMQGKYPDIEIKMYETWKTPDNAKLFSEVAKAYGTIAQGVPTTFIDDKYWIGYADYMSQEIENKIKYCLENNCVNPQDVLTEGSVSSAQEKLLAGISEDEDNKNQSSVGEYSSGPTTQSTCIHVFLDEECDDCSEIKHYLDGLTFEESHFVYHDVTNESNKELYNSFKKIYGIDTAGYPILFIGDNYLVGQNTIKNNIEKLVKDCQTKSCSCPAAKISGLTPTLPKGDYKPESKDILELPLVGVVDIGKMPLFVMTGLIAFVDGFNPCSLWVLTFLLGIVIYSGSRKKIFLVGITFLLVTATAYGLFMLGLLNVFTYVGYTLWIKVLVALIATIFAVVNIKDYFWYKKGISFTISDKHKPKLFKQVRDLMNPNRSITSMLVATAIMSLGIVLVELPCTAGFPMIWTNIISQHKVTGIMFTVLFLMYMVIYLIDEIVVFTGVTLTLKASKFEEKHGRILKLIGGMIMLALAFALVFMSELMNSLLGSIYVFGIATLLSFLIIFVHKKVLPKYGIKIGTEFKEHKNLEEDDKNGNSK